MALAMPRMPRCVSCVRRTSRISFSTSDNNSSSSSSSSDGDDASAPDASSLVVARSLRDVARGGRAVQELRLAASPDLVCRNIMCEHVGDACACRLALVLERVPQLRAMDLSGNQLRALPDATFELAALAVLDVSRNRLAELSPRVAQLQQLEVLDVRGNGLARLPERALLALPKLREVRVAGNAPNLRASLRSPELHAKLVDT